MTARRVMPDRAAHLRATPGAVDSLRKEEGTAVIVVREGRARIADGNLVSVPPRDVGDADWALLGKRSDGTPVLLAAVAPSEDSIDAAPDESWLGLRDSGGVLIPEERELMTTAVALAGWLRGARFCPVCGAETDLEQAGWARRCRGCGREHFPRTDPAVIVAIESSDGERILLGANAQWQGRMYSCFAGFVEAGEPLETAVHREIEEEAGVRLTALRYIASQPWPYPRSLMVGFRATASDEYQARPDGEEIMDVRWFTREEIGSALEGNGPVGLPGEASIARALIRDWYEDAQ